MNQTDYCETMNLSECTFLILLSILGFIWAFPEQYTWIENKVSQLIKRKK